MKSMLKSGVDQRPDRCAKKNANKKKQKHPPLR